MLRADASRRSEHREVLAEFEGGDLLAVLLPLLALVAQELMLGFSISERMF
jgi:hypothetical protein